MKKKELLAPVGDMECLRQAIFNGCDAVYLASKSFGARKFATNFTNEEIVEAIKFSHLYGVKVYVTMNTLVKNNEVEDFLKQAYFLHKNGVDALIVQDFGMICLLREMYPNLEIHASTQANTSSKETCKLFYDLGVKRVVFSRELSIDEIDSIDTSIEKEVFIHGALCISYSGLCLMSSMLGGRSGNRGECTGTCRMPFTLVKNGKILSEKKYLLSTKELNTTTFIKRLLSSSIDSFKIEGRMKSPLYVGFITRFYRKLIDEEAINLFEETNKLKTIFNRDFTKGRLFNAGDKELLNIDSPNHIGLEIGKVIDVNKDKIKIKLQNGYQLNQYDAIRFLKSKSGLVVNFLYDKKMMLTNSSNDICYVDNKINLEKNDIVVKTQDYLLNKEFQNIDQKRINILFEVEAKLGKKLKITISDGIDKFSLEEDAIFKALKIATTKEDIIKKLNKLGDSPFICNKFLIDLDDNIFIPIKIINEMRRKLVDKLISIRKNKKVEVIKKEVVFTKSMEHNKKNNNISCLVRNKEQLDVCLELNVDRVYVAERKLYDLYKDNEKVYFMTERCSFDITNKLMERSLVSEYFDFSNLDVILNYSLNVTNIYTAYYLNKMNIKSITLSPELNELEIEDFLEKYISKFGFTSFEILGYGRVFNMIIKGNILDINVNSYEYNLIDFKNRKFPVYFDGINTYILNYINNDLSKKINNCCIRLDFFDEDVFTIRNIVKKYQ